MVPSTCTGPVTVMIWRRPATSTASTPSTCWPVRAAHMRDANSAVTGNCGVRPRVRQSTPGSQPAPVALEVAGDRDLTRREAERTRRSEVAEVDRSRRRRGRAHLEEGARPGPHLGVVGRQHQVGLGALQDGGDHRRHRRRPWPAGGGRRRARDTNWSCLRASGATSAWPGPVSMPSSWWAVDSDSADSRRSDCTRSGPAPWGWSRTSWTWPRKSAPTVDTCWAAEAQRPHRPELAPEHRQPGGRGHPRSGEVVVGGGELGGGPVEGRLGGGGGQGGRVGGVAHRLQRGQARAGRGGRRTTTRRSPPRPRRPRRRRRRRSRASGSAVPLWIRSPCHSMLLAQAGTGVPPGPAGATDGPARSYRSGPSTRCTPGCDRGAGHGAGSIAPCRSRPSASTVGRIILVAGVLVLLFIPLPAVGYGAHHRPGPVPAAPGVRRGPAPEPRRRGPPHARRPRRARRRSAPVIAAPAVGGAGRDHLDPQDRAADGGGRGDRRRPAAVGTRATTRAPRCRASRATWPSPDTGPPTSTPSTTSTSWSPGDDIEILTVQGLFVYRVISSQVRLSDGRGRGRRPPRTPTLTLTTCNPALQRHASGWWYRPRLVSDVLTGTSRAGPHSDAHAAAPRPLRPTRRSAGAGGPPSCGGWRWRPS